jgi:hypothetical protein
MPDDMLSRAKLGGPFAAVELVCRQYTTDRAHCTTSSFLHHDPSHQEKKGPAGKGRSFKALGRPVFPENAPSLYSMMISSRMMMIKAPVEM